MSLVVMLRGVNVGGHRTFRPTALVAQLAHLDAVNIGAAGTFVIRQPVSVAKLRAELVRRLPFETEIMICPGRDILKLLAQDHFGGQPAGPDIVHLVSLLARGPRVAPATPMYRRQMKAIGYLGELDRLFGVPATTRSLTTITAIAKLLTGEPPQ